MSARTFFTVSSVIFGFIAGIHIGRVLLGWSMFLDGWIISRWLSLFVGICAVCLARVAWRLRHQEPAGPSRSIVTK